MLLSLQVFANVTFLDLNVLALPAMHKKPKFYNGYVSKILSLFLTKYDQVFSRLCMHCPEVSNFLYGTQEGIGVLFVVYMWDLLLH